MSQTDRKAAHALRLLRAYAMLAKPILREQITPNGCIAMTRVTLDVLEHFNIACRPHVCEALLLSPGWVALSCELGRYPTQEEMQQAVSHDVWSVGIGTKRMPGDPPDSPTDWNGHLITVALLGDGRSYLIDPSLDQGARPQYNIIVPPVIVAEAGPAFLDGTAPRVLLPQQMENATAFVRYRTRHDAESYESSPDWCNPWRYSGLALRLIRLMEQEAARWEPTPRAVSARAR